MSAAAHREADRSGVARNLSTRKREKPRFRPFRALFRGFIFWVGVAFAVYLTLLAASRSEGVRRLVTDRLSETLDTEVHLGSLKLTSCLKWMATELEIAGGIPGSGFKAGTLEIHTDPVASLANFTWVARHVALGDIELELVETREGTREPVALTRLAGFAAWKPAPSPAPSRDAPEDAPPPAAREETAPPTRRFSGLGMRFEGASLMLRNATVRVKDAEGVVRLEGVGLIAGHDPGRASPLPPVPRTMIKGEVRHAEQSGGFRPLHVELMLIDGAWFPMPIEVDMRLLRWISDWISGDIPGPLAAPGS